MIRRLGRARDSITSRVFLSRVSLLVAAAVVTKGSSQNRALEHLRHCLPLAS